MTRARDVSKIFTTPPTVYYTDQEALNNLMRYRFVATGGETSISGTDANGSTLSYVAGIEKVYLNGALLVRGYDYIATNGTSITSLSPALVANDVIEVFSFNTFNVANTYTQSQVDALISGVTGPAFSATASALTLSNNTWTKIPFSTEVFDTNNNYNTSNYRFTPTVAGYYYVSARTFMGLTSGRGVISIYKNGAETITDLDLGTNNNGGQSYSVNGLLYMNGSTDYIEAYAIQDTGGNVSINTSSVLTQFSGCMLRKA